MTGAIMGGPIPNSLSAGGLGLDFFGHGAVTATLAAFAELRIEICVDGQVEPTLGLQADADALVNLEADIQPALTLVGQILQIAPDARVDGVLAVNGDIADVLPLVGQVEPILTLNARVDPSQVLEAGIVDQLPLVGQTLELINVEGRVVTTVALTGIIEDC